MNLTHHSPKKKTLCYLTSLFWTSMDWIYPPRCCNCNRWGFVLCEECFSNIEVIQHNHYKKSGNPITGKHDFFEDYHNYPPLHLETRSWAVFSGPARKAIHSLKYQQNLALGPILAKPLVALIKKLDWPIDLIVPVPLSHSRLRSRGYNQSACISSNVASLLDIQHSTTAVKRIRETETQISLDVNKRFTNLMDAFYANPAKLNKKKVLVIDDVITTGATMQHCAIALQKAGVEQVYCLSVAQTILGHPK